MKRAEFSLGRERWVFRGLGHPKPYICFSVSSPETNLLDQARLPHKTCPELWEIDGTFI